MTKIYNTFSISAWLLMGLICVLFITLVMYIEEVIRYGVLTVPIARLFTKVFFDNLWLILLMLVFIFFISKVTGYAISDEGIGTAREANAGWIYVAYVKWEDVIRLEYKYSIRSLGKRLVIHSNEYTYKNKKFIIVDDSRRDFKEIVRIVCEKTNLPLT